MNDLVDPYGVVLSGTGENVSLIPYYTKLPEGVSTIQVTWDGPELLRVYKASEQSTSARTSIATIPAGSGLRSAVISGIGVLAGELLYIGAQLLGTSPASSTSRAAVTVVTVPLKTSGGGVPMFLSRGKPCTQEATSGVVVDLDVGRG